MSLSSSDIFALLVAISFAAGLNVYATVATLGLMGRTGLLELPPSLDLISSWWVIGISAVLFAVEFFADKVPAFDLVWNVLQTFVRIPVAALLAYGATQPLSPGLQLLAVTAAAAISFAAHAGKTAMRAAVTPSPEPASNIGLSLAEDAVAIGLTWFATAHPWIAAAIVVVLLVLMLALVRWIVRGVRAMLRRWRRGPSPAA